jgi:putative aldouronate transport system substrate-binding protein
MKRLVSAAALLALGFSFVFAGGGQQASRGATASGAYQRDPNLNAPGTFPINKQKVALKIGVQQNAMVEDWETNWYTRQIEEKGNYDLSFEVYPGGEMNQKVELMVMAGGADLPDVLIGGFGIATVTKYGQAGMIIPTNIYYQNSAYYINEAKKDLSVDPEKYVTSYDGNIYGMYGILESLNNQYSNGRMTIYEPWLQKLGLNMPQTLDEFLNVLRAFRDRDPNGNGQRDEIPLMSYRDMMGSNYLYTLMMPFIYTQPNFWTVDNNRIDVAFNKPAWRDGIRYSKQLLDEGLLSPLSFTQDATQMTALISPDPTQVGVVVRGSLSNLGATDKKRTEYTMVPPLQGPAGKQSLWMPILPGIAMLITKNCKIPESAFMMGDLFAEEEMAVSNHYGEKGVDWTDAPAGSRGYVEGYAVLSSSLQWGTQQNKHWAENGPQLLRKKWSFPDIATDSPYDYVIPIGKGLPNQIKYATKNPVTGLIYNDQEQEVMNEFHAVILTYVRESYARFVTGDLSIDRNWDSYLAEFNRMGLQDVIRATQSAWDRMNK